MTITNSAIYGLQLDLLNLGFIYGGWRIGLGIGIGLGTAIGLLKIRDSWRDGLIIGLISGISFGLISWFFGGVGAGIVIGLLVRGLHIGYLSYGGFFHNKADNWRNIFKFDIFFGLLLGIIAWLGVRFSFSLFAVTSVEGNTGLDEPYSTAFKAFSGYFVVSLSAIFQRICLSYQRLAVIRKQLLDIIQELQEIDSIDKLADAWPYEKISKLRREFIIPPNSENADEEQSDIIEWNDPIEQIDTLAAARIYDIYPVGAIWMLKGTEEAEKHINTIFNLAREYLTRKTLVGQVQVLDKLRPEIDAFFIVMNLVQWPVKTDLKSLAEQWLNIIENKKANCLEQLASTPIPNPYVAGNPLQHKSHNLFKGRKDIIVAIEENIINPGQRPALLLYGRRRIGKTSTLLNLPRLLSSQFTPVFIDCQNAKWRDGDAAFCYHLASSVYGEFQRNLLDSLGKPALEQFEKYAFTRLDEFLDKVETLSLRINKQILLTFDEYERLEEGIAAQKITREVFNQLRNIVQHRARIVVLFSGGHRFEELRVVNWSDYLINVKTLELSFLAPEDAQELLTEPVPALHYEMGVVDAIIALTHCQPYLLQALASDLINYLNAQKQQTAAMADLDVAVAKVLVTADAYFHNNWEECTEAEREVLRVLATGTADTAAAPQNQAEVQSLSRKEIVEMRDGRYCFAVELFKLWILKNHFPAFQENSGVRRYGTYTNTSG